MSKFLFVLFLVLTTACQAAPVLEMSVQERQTYVDSQLADFSNQEKPLMESAEGGTLVVYSDGEEIQKIEATRMGEMGKSFEEYYFADGLLDSAVITQTTYNRPIYWDEQMAAESGDTEAFDLAKSVVTEVAYDYRTGDSSEEALQWKESASQLLQDFFRD